MAGKKYVRVSDTRYEQHSEGSDSPLKWARAPEHLYIELFEASVIEGDSYNRLPSFFEETRPLKSDGLVSTKKIRAVGRTEGQRDISTIGSEGPSHQACKEMSVTLIGTAEDLAGSKRHGTLIHDSGGFGSDKVDAQSLDLSILIPQSTFDRAWTAIKTGAVSQIILGVHVAVFRCEVDRNLAEGWMHQTYYVEVDSGNAATFDALYVASPKTIPKPKTSPEELSESSLDDALKTPIESLLQKNNEVMNQIANHLKVASLAIVVLAVALVIRNFR